MKDGISKITKFKIVTLDKVKYLYIKYRKLFLHIRSMFLSRLINR